MEAIVAIDLKNGISKNGIIPWKSKKDMSHFYKKTNGNIVIMGRNTFFSIPEERRPLKNRLNIVVTTNPQFYQDSITDSNITNVIFTNEQDLYNDFLLNPKKYNNLYPFLIENFKVFVIGGKQIYEKFIPFCNIIWLTQIKSEHNCDLFWEIDENKLNNKLNNKFDVTEIEDDDELVIYKYERIILNCN